MDCGPSRNIDTIRRLTDPTRLFIALASERRPMWLTPLMYLVLYFSQEIGRFDRDSSEVCSA